MNHKSSCFLSRKERSVDDRESHSPCYCTSGIKSIIFGCTFDGIARGLINVVWRDIAHLTHTMTHLPSLPLSITIQYMSKHFYTKMGFPTSKATPDLFCYALDFCFFPHTRVKILTPL